MLYSSTSHQQRIFIVYGDKRKKAKKRLKSSGLRTAERDELLRIISTVPSAEDQIRAMLASKKKGLNNWRGLIAVPPSSILDSILSEFVMKTNIPLEIPFFVLFHVVSGYLLKNDVSLDVQGQKIVPDIWTIILASSGAGKTFTQKIITKSLDITDIEFKGTGIASSAKFVEELNKMPKGFWLRDEFAQFLKKLETAGPMEEMKDYLLRLYDNDTITRSTQKYDIEINDPALTILGLTVLETFSNYVDAESMLDGFAQRFNYVISEADPDRNFIDYPIWEIDTSSWLKQWIDTTSIIHKKYRTTPKSIDAFKSSFRLIYKHDLPESFFRRVAWKAHKYALIYHIIRKDKRDVLTLEDYGWAARALSMHLDDAATLIGDKNISDLEKLIQSAEKIANRVRDTGKEVKPRDLILGVYGIKTVQQAEAIMRIMDTDEMIMH